MLKAPYDSQTDQLDQYSPSSVHTFPACEQVLPGPFLGTNVGAMLTTGVHQTVSSPGLHFSQVFTAHLNVLHS